MDPELELELERERERARARRARSGQPQKFGMVEAAGMGALDGLTFNTTDEIAGGVAYGNRRPMTTAESMRNINRAPQLQLKEVKDRDEFARRDAAAREVGDRVTNQVREAQERARTDRPLTYIAGAIGSGLLTGKGLSGAASTTTKAVGAAGNAARNIPGVSTVANVAGRVTKPISSAAAKVGGMLSKVPGSAVVRAAGKGMGPGAMYAALAAMGEAKDDRLTAGLNATGPGALLGAGFGAAGKIGAGGLGVLWNVLGRPSSEKAVATLSRMMEKNNIKPIDAAMEVNSRAKGGGKVFETSAEFMGPSAEAMQTALGNVPGPSQDLLQKAFIGSIRNMRQNLNASAKKATGKDPERYHETKRTQEAERLKRDKANYDAVQGHPLGGNRMPTKAFNDILFSQNRANPHLAPLGKRPAFLSYVRDTLKAAEQHGDFMRHELKRFLQMVDDGKMPRRALSNRAINEIDKRMTQDLDVAVAKGRNNDARILGELQDELRKTDYHTGLGGARDTAAIGLTAKEALVQGRKAFHSNVDLEEVTSKLTDYPQEIADSYLTGMVREMSDSLANQSNLGGLADAAQKIAATPAMRDKLIAALPKTSKDKLTTNSQRFMALLDRVTKHTNRARQVYGNSATMPRMAAEAEAAAETTSLSGDVMDFVGELITRQPGKISERFGNAVRNRVTRPGIYNPKINEELGKRLAATGKDDILGVLDEIAAYRQRPTPVLSSDRPSQFAARMAGQRGGTSSAENDPWAQDSAGARADVVVEGLERPMIAEYLAEDTTPERRAEIEAMFGRDAQGLRDLRARTLN